MLLEPSLDSLRRILAGSRHLLVLTGAGCSTESGIPDYRSADGTWKRRPPIRYVTFVRDDAARRRYWARSFAGWPRFSAARPNAAHRVLARWEEDGRIDHVITQNVDELHQAAGSRRVLDLHGRLSLVRCLACHHQIRRDELQQRMAELNPEWEPANTPIAPDGDADLAPESIDGFRVPGCPRCRGLLKPDVVFFGESVPRSRVHFAMARVESADAMLVVGSSLMVWSGFRFARAAAQAGVPLAIVNLGKTRADDLATVKVERPCGEAMEALGL